MSLSTRFIPAIPTSKGELKTLEDAARYIMTLPAAMRAKPEWDFAGREVVRAIEGKSVEMLARMAIMNALSGKQPGVPDPPPPRDPSKDKVHEFRTYKKRDSWRK